MSQHKLFKGPLLDKKGNLVEAGYAFSLVKEYKRSAIKASKYRIKEWDYYYVGDDEYGIALTIADNSYMSLYSVSVLDFKNKKEWTKSYMKWFTFGLTKLPSASVDGDTDASGSNYEMHFINKNGKRELVVSKFKNLSKGIDFSCDVKLSETSENSMVIATPFNKKKHFYYNQKINNMKAVGHFSFGPISHTFKANACAVLDWGRGVWTYSNTWYWSSLNARSNGHYIGFNLGYGFGDTSKASENMFFVDDEAFKLEDVTFNIPLNDKGKDDYLSTWTLTSESKDINLTFKPLIDRYSNTNALLIQSKQHQVFGVFSGTITIRGKKFEIDNLIGFAEKVKNRW